LLKKMKKLIIVLVLLVFLFGCGLVPSGNDGKTTRKGFGSSSGLSIKFVEDEPQKEVVHGRPIKFTLNVRNTGLFTIPSGSFMAQVVGLDNSFNPSERQGTNSNQLAEVDDSGVGGESNVELGSTSYNPEQMLDDRIIKSGDLEVQFCYPYETHVVVDNFWIGAKTSDVSKGSISSGDNSNAPVHVSELEETGGGIETYFSFKVKVVGKGSVVSACFPSSDDDRKRNVELEIIERSVSCYYKDSGEQKDIGSKGTIILNSQNEKVVHCRIPFDGEKPIKSQLQIKLSYNYLDSIPVPAITITRV